MPTYEFGCPQGHKFDRFYRKMSDSVSELPCPECGATAARRVSGGAGLVFKGSGFYITDYGKDGKKGPPAAGGGVDKKADSAGATGGEGKSESQAESASKAESKSESRSESKSESASEAKTAAKSGEGSSSKGTPGDKGPSKSE